NRSDNLGLLYQANVLYAAELIEAALVSNCHPTVVLVGSAAEYGRPIRSNGIVRENDCCSPMTAYGISKLAQTHHGLAAAVRGLPVVVARLFNPIGTGSTQATALGNFVAQIAAMGPQGGILKTGPLGAVRDFVDVAVAAKVLAELATLPEAIGQVINL